MKKFYTLLFAMFSLNVANAQWVLQNSSTENDLYSVYFTDVNVGYTADGDIYKTTDGGANWVYQYSDWGGKIVYFPNTDTGYAGYCRFDAGQLFIQYYHSKPSARKIFASFYLISVRLLQSISPSTGPVLVISRLTRSSS